MKDYYKILGCSPQDRKSTFYSAFKSKLYEAHKNPEDARYKSITSLCEAYSVLSSRKKQYNRLYSVRILGKHPNDIEAYKKFERKWLPRIKSAAEEGILKGARLSKMSDSRLKAYFFFSPIRRFFEGLFDTIGLLLDIV